MKKGILFLLLLGSFFARAQSLKEALFSGKLKNEPGTVIRKGDDLSTKMDTSTRRVVANTDSVKTNTATTTANNPVNAPATQTATAQTTAGASSAYNPPAVIPPAAGSETAQKPATTTAPAESTPTGETTAAAAEAAPAEAKPVEAKPKDNTALFKEFMQEFKSTLDNEVVPNKKLKKGSYYIQLTYVIGTDGQTTVTDLYVDPENKFLQQQIADRLATEMPKLSPVLQSNGTARKQTKRYNFTLEKQ